MIQLSRVAHNLVTQPGELEHVGRLPLNLFVPVHALPQQPSVVRNDIYTCAAAAHTLCCSCACMRDAAGPATFTLHDIVLLASGYGSSSVHSPELFSAIARRILPIADELNERQVCVGLRTCLSCWRQASCCALCFPEFYLGPLPVASCACSYLHVLVICRSIFSLCIGLIP